MVSRRKREKAFDLFSKNWKTYEVARKLKILYSDAQKLRILFLKSEEVSAEEQRKITTSYLEDLERQKEQRIKESLRRFRAISDRFETTVNFIVSNQPDAQKITVCFLDAGKMAVWERET